MKKAGRRENKLYMRDNRCATKIIHKYREIQDKVMVSRRRVLELAATSGLVATAGCLDEDTTSDDNSNSNPSISEGNNGQNCRMETRTETQTLADKSESVSAGNEWIFYGDVEEGDVLIVEARKIGGEARPALEVEDPYGNIVAQNDPSEMIHREIQAYHEGRYYIRFPNEALINSGMWDVKVSTETEYQEEVCS